MSVKGRVYQRSDGHWEVRWQTSRHYKTEEEARAAAELGLPPHKSRARVSDEIAQVALRLHEAGIPWSAIALALSAAGVRTPRGKSRWDGGTLKAAAVRWRDRRDKADAEAVRAEHHVEEVSQ